MQHYEYCARVRRLTVWCQHGGSTAVAQQQQSPGKYTLLYSYNYLAPGVLAFRAPKPLPILISSYLPPERVSRHEGISSHNPDMKGLTRNIKSVVTEQAPVTLE